MWPDEIANSIECYERNTGKVKLVPKLGALRLILELARQARERERPARLGGHPG
jgi:hypothetical protein